MSISKLLYPLYNPDFYPVASVSVVVTGLLLIPFAGYIHRRMRSGSPVIATIATAAFAGGAICMIFAGFISSHPLHGTSSLPKLHTILARAAGIGLSVGIMVFDACAVKKCFGSSNGRTPYKRSLLILWNLTTLPSLLVVSLWLLKYAHLHWLDQFYRTLHGTAAWHLGFWEWIGSAAVFLFLFSSALLLPEHAPE